LFVTRVNRFNSIFENFRHCNKICNHTLYLLRRENIQTPATATTATIPSMVHFPLLPVLSLAKLIGEEKEERGDVEGVLSCGGERLDSGVDLDGSFVESIGGVGFGADSELEWLHSATTVCGSSIPTTLDSTCVNSVHASTTAPTVVHSNPVVVPFSPITDIEESFEGVSPELDGGMVGEELSATAIASLVSGNVGFGGTVESNCTVEFECKFESAGDSEVDGAGPEDGTWCEVEGGSVASGTKERVVPLGTMLVS
jgi:hypothetical protein